jgi:hypothetical protein
MPSRQEQELGYMIQVVYNPLSSIAPEAGRNIFAFYEPPEPCPTCPTPLPPTPKPIIATPTPQLPFEIYGASPQSVYAGSKSFRIEVTGDRYTPDAKIYFNNVELPTSYVNAQRLAANVPANMIAMAGSPAIKVQTPDGSKYSLQTNIIIQPPPTPNFTYIGMIARKRYNNDTAYFMEQGKQTPSSYRLNDTVGGRFRLINIDAERVVLEDVNLGFRHEVKLDRTMQASTGPAGRPGQRFPTPGGFQPYNPGDGQVAPAPGIPPNVPIYRPPQRPGAANSNSNAKPDVDDEDDEDTDNR